MEQRRTERVEGEREILEKTRRPAASSGHGFHLRKSGVNRPGIEHGSPWWQASSLTAQPPWPLLTTGVNNQRIVTSGAFVFLACTFSPRGHALMSPVTREQRGSITIRCPRQLQFGNFIQLTSFKVENYVAARPWSRSDRTMRATLTRTPSASSLLRQGVQCFRRANNAGECRNEQGPSRHSADSKKDEALEKREIDRYRERESDLLSRESCISSRSEVGLPSFRAEVPFRNISTPLQPPWARFAYQLPSRVRGAMGADSSLRTPRRFPPPPYHSANSYRITNHPRSFFSSSSSTQHPHAASVARDFIKFCFLGAAVSLLASHMGEPGFIPSGVAPGFFCICENREGRCRWSAGILGGLRFAPPLHSRAAPYSPLCALIGSQDLAIKSRLNLCTSFSTPLPEQSPIHTEHCGWLTDRMVTPEKSPTLSTSVGTASMMAPLVREGKAAHNYSRFQTASPYYTKVRKYRGIVRAATTVHAPNAEECCARDVGYDDPCQFP
ncbi:hypothetical protein PR048_022066 [Dryococelus australis]|uniref:Uncharacterized protein n=1 Tax=Dryococelus australis TaxID=614101 RepID=A0ABQ9H077_9NEOP|nr:hypothetical protein PR048_022066 [Dryococelus australis]